MGSVAAENRRKKLIQLIHVGKAKMGLADDMYRALLAGVTGKQSCAEMDEKQLSDVLWAMRRNGFAQAPLRAPRVQPEDKGRATLEQLEYIRGMWHTCARNKSDAALMAFVNRVSGVDGLRFLDVGLARKVILALRQMMIKAGYDPDTSRRRNA